MRVYYNSITLVYHTRVTKRAGHRPGPGQGPASNRPGSWAVPARGREGSGQGPGRIRPGAGKDPARVRGGTGQGPGRIRDVPGKGPGRIRPRVRSGVRPPAFPGGGRPARGVAAGRSRGFGRFRPAGFSCCPRACGGFGRPPAAWYSRPVLSGLFVLRWCGAPGVAPVPSAPYPSATRTRNEQACVHLVREMTIGI